MLIIFERIVQYIILIFLKTCNYCWYKPTCPRTGESLLLIQTVQHLLSCFLDSNWMSRSMDGNLWLCQINVDKPIHPVSSVVNNWRSAPISPIRSSYTPRSRSRTRIVSPHPRRICVTPWHFDSSPDLDEAKRCKRRVHDPLKAAQDFIDNRGKPHAIYNECRELDEIRYIFPQLSGFSMDDEEDNENDSRDGDNISIHIPPLRWRLNLGLQLDSMSLRIDFSISTMVGSSYLMYCRQFLIWIRRLSTSSLFNL